MNLSQKLGRAGHKVKLYLHRASPTILCCVASVGVVGTAIMAARATYKALHELKIAKNRKDDLTKFEIFVVMAPNYIPTTVIGIGTIACIFGTNILNKGQRAMLISAYTLAGQQFREYKEKLKELYGEETHNNVMDVIIKEKCKDVYISAPGLVDCSTLDPDSEVKEVVRLFYDHYSKRYFESTLSRVIQAEYHLNRNFMMAYNASVNEFYEFLGLEKIPSGDLAGWDIYDEIYWIDFNHRTILLESGLEVIGIEMVLMPTIPDL